MPNGDGQDRHSKVQAADLVTDPEEKARLEARNALRQFDAAITHVDEWLERTGDIFRLRPSLIMGLHRFALDGISEQAGSYRSTPVEITQSSHTPPEAAFVPLRVEEMCDYVNDSWDTENALHLSSFAMWRLNWIHPFSDGNGRTSRAVSYIILCCKLGYHLPGRPTIPEQIAEDKAPYYKALEHADKNSTDIKIDVSKMEELLQEALASQLMSIHQQATSGAKKASERKLH